MNTTPTLPKVTAFITRRHHGRPHLLLFRHPYAGIQLPSGTVEPGESPPAAALREAQEETGLRHLGPPLLCGEQAEALPAGRCLIFQTTGVYARPHRDAFNWATLRRGLPVRVEREEEAWVQVTYREHATESESSPLSYQITGWVPHSTLAWRHHRFFYEIACLRETPERWTQLADGAHFELFWAPLEALPSLVSFQRGWPSLLPGARYARSE